MHDYYEFLNEERIANSWSDKDKKEFAKLQLDNLFESFDALKKYKIKHWIDCGTLLGIYRDGGLIPGDSDTDIGLLAEDMSPDFVEDFFDNLGGIDRSPMFFRPEDYLKLIKDGGKPVPPKSMQFRLLKKGRQKTYKGKRIYADIFMYYPFKKDRIYKFGRRYFRTKDSILQAGTKNMTVDGNAFPILQQTEEHLVVTYGKAWTNPDPGFKINDNKVYGGPLLTKDIGGEYLYDFSTGKYTVE